MAFRRPLHDAGVIAPLRTQPQIPITISSTKSNLSARNGRKVFGIGLGKTGTSSLAMAMSQLGFRAKHSPRDVDQIGDYEFANDIAVAWRFRFLDHIYPEAKFILTIRDMSSWLSSCGDRSIRHKSKGPLRQRENRFMCFGRIDFDAKSFEVAYRRHVDDVILHFRYRPEKLLMMDICGGQGWETLCPFLGVSVPARAFPHKNRKTE